MPIMRFPLIIQKMFGLIPQLETWEDHVQAYQQANEATDEVMWYKVDILCSLLEKFGKSSLAEFSRQVKEKETTFVSYVRTARAFPPEKRIAAVPFETHLRASYADPYKNQQFLGENRFKMLEMAADQELSSRKVRKIIHDEKMKKTLQVEIIPCWWCGLDSGEIIDHIFYSPHVFRQATHYHVHQLCFSFMQLALERGRDEHRQENPIEAIPRQATQDAESAV